MSHETAGRSRDPRVALVIVTSAFSAMLLSANLATPLYAVWARQFGFSTAVLALIFAAVTGGGALILAAWHLRNRGKPASQTVPAQEQERAGRA